MESCRICRGEATASMPLLHPCKCRGLIKYIHQECLLEWLKHLNKSTLKCDICNTPYRFRTIYDPQMPLRMPFKYLWAQFVQTVKFGVIRVVLILLYIACVLILIPLYFKFCGRVFTWLVDGKFPSNVSQFYRDLIFSERYKMHLNIYPMTYNSANLSTFSLTSPAAAVESLADGNINPLFDPFNLEYIKYIKGAFTVFLYHTYLPGLGYVLVMAVLMIAVFIEHEYLVRDSGYTKLLMRSVGDEPRVKLMEVLELLIEGMRGRELAGNGNAAAENVANAVGDAADQVPPPTAAAAAAAAAGVPNREQLIRALEDLRREPDVNTWPEEALRRFIEERQRNAVNIAPEEDNANANLAQLHDELHEDHVDRQDLLDRFLAENLIGEPELEHPNENDLAFNDNGNDNDNDNFDIMGDLQGRAPAQLNNNNIFDDFNEIEFEDPEDDQDNDMANGNDVNLEDEDEEVIEEAPDGDLFDLLGINFNLLRTPLFLLVIGCVICTLYLTVVYLIPYFIGHVTFSILQILCFPLRKLVSKIPSIRVKSDSPLVAFIFESLINPSLFFVYRLLDLGATPPFSIQFEAGPESESLFGSYVDYQTPGYVSYLFPGYRELSDKVAYVLTGYFVITFAVYRLMTIISSARKPIMGNPRKLYKVLFEVAMTAKVFVVFAIDVVCFPMFCGWLLDFCIAPLLLQKFIFKESPYLVFLWALYYVSPYGFFPQLIAYWFLGTFYMVFFALFVGMTREKIMRKGVLFFIRLPEDPNTRLVHDALTQPFRLQMLRIQLSARGYLGLILICIGVVTWLIRSLLPSLFPIRLGSLGNLAASEVATNVSTSTDSFNSTISGYMFQYLFPILALASMGRDKQLITNIVSWYWTKVFAICCHRLRLSHFILGKPIAQERGHLIYRNLFEQILATAQPDFSKPVTLKEAKTIFKETNTKVVFVPDGNHVRAPDSDASRRFIKTLFVAVTKDDQLIPVDEAESKKAKKKEINDLEYELDDEDNYTNTYSIVYRPPMLKTRCFVLIFMLWVFATFFILSILFMALYIGRVFSWAGDLGLQYLGEPSANENLTPQADLIQVILGLVVMQNFISLVNEKFYSTDFDILRSIKEWLGPIVLGISYCLVLIVWANWIAGVHKWCVDVPLRGYLTDRVDIYENGGHNEFLILKGSLMHHFLTSLFTLLPFSKVLLQIMKDYFASRRRFYQPKFVWKNYILPPIGYFIVTVLPCMVGFGYSSAIGLVLFASCKTIWSAVKLYTELSLNVKNDKYLKGKAIENHDN